jgi:hypothetical protein
MSQPSLHEASRRQLEAIILASERRSVWLSQALDGGDLLCADGAQRHLVFGNFYRLRENCRIFVTAADCASEAFDLS